MKFSPENLTLTTALSVVFVGMSPFNAVADNMQQYTAADAMPYLAFDKLKSKSIELKAARLKVAFAPGEMKASKPALMNWVERSGRAIETYYGRFPVRRARILLVPSDGSETSGGQAFGNAGAAVRLMVGSEITAEALRKDWQLPHEIAHLAFPNVQIDTWLSEGMAVYVEPIARVQAGDLTPEKIWAEFTKMMPTGLPEQGAKGFAETEKRERIYWGGAMFWLIAELEIRKRSDNKVGVQTALRAISDAGGTIENIWSSEQALAVGDKATGHNVLVPMYKQWQVEPQSPDLERIWHDLGITTTADKVTFDDNAPLAKVRKAITAKLAVK